MRAKQHRVMSFAPPRTILNDNLDEAKQHSLSTLIERVFLMAPLQDMRRRSWRGFSDDCLTLTGRRCWPMPRTRCSSKYACTAGFSSEWN